jgi:hypothetical protein
MNKKEYVLSYFFIYLMILNLRMDVERLERVVSISFSRIIYYLGCSLIWSCPTYFSFNASAFPK